MFYCREGELHQMNRRYDKNIPVSIARCTGRRRPASAAVCDSAAAAARLDTVGRMFLPRRLRNSRGELMPHYLASRLVCCWT